MIAQPEILYATLILPSLFAVTLIGEGVNKITKHESGTVSLLVGSIFLAIIVGAYFLVLRK